MGTKGEIQKRVIIGLTIFIILGFFLGFPLVLSGSFFEWQSDNALGLYKKSGFEYQNLLAGDGKISLALGILGVFLFAFAFMLRSENLYKLTAICSILLALFALYEIVTLLIKPGVIGVGFGLYMVLGGSVISLLCSFGSYMMLSQKES
ncbi:MAG: hypothetical protein PHO53_04205 [Actinomycetota bacterium]|nr:hypothetical protein [Actinomycetota bacterium]